MSVVALAWAKRQTAGGVAAKAVLMVLADYADETGLCWPSQALIASECELTDRSVRDQLRKLEAAGLIAREEYRRRDGTQGSDRIRLALRNSRNDVPIRRNELPAAQPERRSQPPEGASALTTFEPPQEPPQKFLGASSDAPQGAGDMREAARPPAVVTPAAPWDRAPAFGELWLAATPEMRRRARSKAKVWPEWSRALGHAAEDEILAGMRGYLNGDPDVKRTGGPGLHIWLRDRTWESWAPSTGAAAATLSAARWAIAVEIWREEGRWDEQLGPPPGAPGCRAPPHLLISPAVQVVA